MVQHLRNTALLDVLELFQHHAPIRQIEIEYLHIEHLIALHLHLLEGLYHFLLNEETRKTKIFKRLSEILRLLRLNLLVTVHPDFFGTFLPLQLDHAMSRGFRFLLMRRQMQIVRVDLVLLLDRFLEVGIENYLIHCPQVVVVHLHNQS